MADPVIVKEWIQKADEDFDLNNYVLPVKLTDTTESGGLFGFRFD